MIVCNQVMKFLLDRIDKDERQAAKRKKKEEVVEAKRRLANAGRLSSLLYRHKESLKTEILKKRALLDKELQLEAQVAQTSARSGVLPSPLREINSASSLQEELKKDLLRIRREKERAQAAAQQQAAAKQQAAALSQQQHSRTHSSQHHHRGSASTATAATSPHKRKRAEEERETTKSKKKKMISTSSSSTSSSNKDKEKKDTKLYCICKTPYDETK